ncbi:MAG: hypothetical protein JSS83_19295 [Cyanobacteria bacterium SZAS LIN-3]|nr:hypothetical protein [Cyanobacteria bacterium SZAS LIN-3]
MFEVEAAQLILNSPLPSAGGANLDSDSPAMPRQSGLADLPVGGTPFDTSFVAALSVNQKISASLKRFLLDSLEVDNQAA